MSWTQPARGTDSSRMDFIPAAEAVTALLATRADDAAPDAALYLTIMAWAALAEADPAWDRFGLELLDIRTRLYPDSGIVVDARPPAHDEPRLRQSLTGLVAALADHHDTLAADERLGLALRLEHDAAAHQLHYAVGVLP